jgi:hypothetical protein
VIAHCSERLRGGFFGVNDTILERKRALTEFGRQAAGFGICGFGPIKSFPHMP